MFDKVGNPLTLGGTATYLNSATNPKEDLSAVTIADYTYILNKKKVVAITPLFLLCLPQMLIDAMKRLSM